jgi:hypothetical protein
MDDFLDANDSISSWEDDSAATTRQEDTMPNPSEAQLEGYNQIDSLRNYIKLTMKSARDKKTLKLIEAALESIKKFDATYEKVASLRSERVQFASADSTEPDPQEEDEDEVAAEVAECEPPAEVLTLDAIESAESEEQVDSESEDYEDPSSGSDYADDVEIDPARLKQHRRFLQLVVQHTNEFLRSGAGPFPFPPTLYSFTP